MPFSEDHERQLIRMLAVSWLKAAMRDQRRAARLWRGSPVHINDWAVEHCAQAQLEPRALYARARARMEMYFTVHREYANLWETD